MNNVSVGMKVVCLYTGDKGVVTGINNEADSRDVMGETAWWVLWETGGCKGNQYWTVESDLIVFSEYDPEDYPEHKEYQNKD